MVNIPIVRSEVTETGFGFYGDDQIRAMSVCRVTSPVAQDALGNAIRGGLRDARLGPTEQNITCSTCNFNYINCPGHPGHVELDVPVYHPMLFASMFSLLRSKCAFCHKLRLSNARIRRTLVKLQLLEMGDVSSATSLDDMAHPPIAEEDKENLHAADFEDKLKRFEETYKWYAKSPNRRRADPYTKQLQRDVIDAFLRSAMAAKKCENCGAFSPPLRKDGFTKIFRKPMPKRLRKSMHAMRVELKSALEELQGGENANEANDSDDDSEYDEANDDSPDEADKYLVPLEVEAQIKLVWRQHADVFDFIWSRSMFGGLPSAVSSMDGWKLFFIRAILVPPNRFRPSAVVGDALSEHPQNVHLSKIIETNEKIRIIQAESQSARHQLVIFSDTPGCNSNDEDGASESDGVPKIDTFDLSKLVGTWITLQNSVNCYMDSAKDPNPLANAGPAGIRQLLERKEGLFRKNMMGKRVNYCCRSVISPDNYIGTNEIGIPVQFAKTLHYPTPVSDWNFKYLMTLVERGPFEYPGANLIETADGKIIKLEKLSAADRAAKAKLLLASKGNKVYRHLIDGDVLLVNRQPSLHKPSIMAHKARVLKHVKEQTIRMHYANCNSYNADFDGDEMNCHFVQNELARAEANFIMNTDNQYIVPTSGNPLRGLIQDHVAGAVKLTCKDTFLTKQEFQQLLFVAVSGLPGTEIVGPMDTVVTPPPAILKPWPMWTGKQVISSLLNHMCRPPLPPLHLDGKTRTPPTAFGNEEQEHIVVIRFGELLTGVMDKAAIGNSSLGIVHAVFELYGPEHAGRLLNALGKLMTYFLQDAGHTCGIEDLTLLSSADKQRNILLSQVAVETEKGLQSFLDNDAGVEAGASSSTARLSAKQVKENERRISALLHADRKNGKVRLDGAMQGVINKSASEVIKACLPNGLELPFLKNSFTLMVSTGAKGSGVNQSQITCFLGQQALEGQRVPMMVSGKTLPSFRAYDSSPRAGGFVRDRFLTGVKPQEYYFHCMAGREGLVDTAVKTSRSGYLQRCLIKHLEELKVHYDMTVRDSGGNVVQFLYGEDGLDPVNTAVLGGKPNQMLFLARNNQALVHKYALNNANLASTLDFSSADQHHRNMEKAKMLMTSIAANTRVDWHSLLAVGSVVMTRRKLRADFPWSMKNISKVWTPAEVVKIRKTSSLSDASLEVDLRYTSDGIVEKRVPAYIVSQKGGQCVPTIKPGLLDTAMNSLNVGSCVGCCSEKIQDAITNYARINPDGAITQEGSNDVSSSSSTSNVYTVSPKELELLVWVKYMRSMACPGEAVGCIAAQSIGEPSTQMTLNTFHLAGHGGANVTLGIPRLREIIMTASKSLKTPTMTFTLGANHTIASAKSLARQLSRLSLSQLLDHNGGVEVGERLEYGDSGFLERNYRIRLLLANPLKIHEAFGVSFADILKSVKSMFLSKLSYIIKLEQRRAGERTSGKQDAISQFRSSTSGEYSNGRRGKRGGGEDGDDSDGGGEDGNAIVDMGDLGDNEARGATAGKKNSKHSQSSLDKLLDSDDDDDEDDDADSIDDDNDINVSRAKKNAKEGQGYEDDIDDDDESDVENNRDNSINSNKKGGSKGAKAGAEEDDEDGDKMKKKPFKDENSDDDSGETSDDSDDVFIGSLTKGAKSKGNTKSMKLSKRGGTLSSSQTIKEDGLISNEREGWIEMKLTFPSQSRKLLMVQLAERAAQGTTVRSTKNIANAYAQAASELSNSSGGWFDGKCVGVQTEGVNFQAIWGLPEDLVDYNHIKSNDIWAILQTYGVEAARQSIVSEMNGVFGVYGIDVNPRHLSLIADFMTRTGSYVAMNRIGMVHCPSTLLQMSFETTCTFLLKAAQEGTCDNQESPSARIVLGNVAKIGTGCFDVMIPVEKSSHQSQDQEQ